jgi:hypothetical protein
VESCYDFCCSRLITVHSETSSDFKFCWIRQQRREGLKHDGHIRHHFTPPCAGPDADSACDIIQRRVSGVSQRCSCRVEHVGFDEALAAAATTAATTATAPTTAAATAAVANTIDISPRQLQAAEAPPCASCNQPSPPAAFRPRRPRNYRHRPAVCVACVI